MERGRKGLVIKPYFHLKNITGLFPKVNEVNFLEKTFGMDVS